MFRTKLAIRLSGPRVVSDSRILVRSLLSIARVAMTVIVNISKKAITPTNIATKLFLISVVKAYVAAEAKAPDSRILADDDQSTVAPYSFFIHRNAMSKLGIPDISVVTISPMIPNLLISRMLNGKPMAKVISCSFRLNHFPLPI